MMIAALLAGGIVSGKAYELSHPCLLHTEADFEYAKSHLGEEPYASALKKLKGSQYCKTSYRPSPVEYLARLDATNWKDLNSRWENAGIADLWYEGIHNNYTQFMRDAAAAYQLALLYKLEGNRNAADASKNILVEWSKKNKGILVNRAGEIIDPNERLIMFQPYQMAVAAEMLRDYNEWGAGSEFKGVVEWLDKSFYWVAKAQLDLQNASGGGHYWQNWDLASMTTILSLGILADKESYITEAIDYYKGKGGGPGNILKGVPYLHRDTDSEEMLGQGNELGRDQGHNTLCASVLGTFCQMGLAIGEDLFAYDDYRALKFAEYVAKYNLAQASLYPDPMQNFTAMGVGSSDKDFVYPHSGFPYMSYTYGDGGVMSEPSQASRGMVRPGWDCWAGYANDHGLSAIYSCEMAERIRPDGGGGQYSTNSGGFDQIGFSTLMNYRPYKAPEAADTQKFECIADTWVREDSPRIVNGSTGKIELKKNDIQDDDKNVIGANYHIGLMTFTYHPAPGRELERGTLHLVTERVKGGDVSVYAYPNDFNEATANWDTERTFVAAVGAPITAFTAAGQKGKSIYDGGISEDNCNLAAWTNDVDITEYLQTLPEGTAHVSFMLRQHGDQVCFFSKDNQGQANAFAGTAGATNLLASELKPYLEVKYVEVVKPDEDEEKGDEEEPGTGEDEPGDEREEPGDVENPDTPDDPSEDAGVGAFEGEMQQAEYYTLQGLKIPTPRAGECYIVKTGDKVMKIIYLEK